MSESKAQVVVSLRNYDSRPMTRDMSPSNQKTYFS